MKAHCRFKVGDVVRLRTGKTPMYVQEISADGSRIIALYGSEINYRPFGALEVPVRKWRHVEDFVQHQPSLADDFGASKETTVSQKLYQTKDSRFGTLLATNSEGKLVLEMKGNAGEVLAFDRADLEEVRPYTVQCLELNDGDVKTHWTTVKGTVELGDLIVTKTGKLLLVVALDTKQDGRAPLQGRKFNTVPLGDAPAAE